MTAPMTRGWPPQVVFIVLLLIVVAIAIPFGRRGDWAGWIALLAMIACNLALWTMLVWGILRSLINWWRDRHQAD